MANALNATVAKRSRNGAVLAGSAAAAMAGMALWNTYRAKKVRRDHPPRGRFVAVDGAQLHYLEKGGGRPVVFLHGNVVTAESPAPGCRWRGPRMPRSLSRAPSISTARSGRSFLRQSQILTTFGPGAMVPESTTPSRARRIILRYKRLEAAWFEAIPAEAISSHHAASCCGPRRRWVCSSANTKRPWPPPPRRTVRR
jgi:hypothetical protein